MILLRVLRPDKTVPALKKYIADDKYIKPVDIIRPNDFFGDNMKKVVEFYLQNFVADRGVNEALLVGELQKYTLNNEPAEITYMRVVESLPIGLDVNKMTTEYLVRLYRLRKEMLKFKRNYILKLVISS